MITYAFISDKGSRDQNEDYVRVSEKKGMYCFALADGLGGHGHGEVASKLVVDSVIESFDESEVQDVEKFLIDAIETGQKKLLAKQKEEHKADSMKTTIVICVINQSYEAYWAFVGDSRLYCFKWGMMYQRTKDHSVPQMLTLAGDIKEKEIRFHPDRNRLLRVVGTEWSSPQYELDECRRAKGRKFLLCSDGFWEMIVEKEMIACLRQSHSMNEWLDSMVKLVSKRVEEHQGDNYSAICISCD